MTAITAEELLDLCPVVDIDDYKRPNGTLRKKAFNRALKKREECLETALAQRADVASAKGGAVGKAFDAVSDVALTVSSLFGGPGPQSPQAQPASPGIAPPEDVAPPAFWPFSDAPDEDEDDGLSPGTIAALVAALVGVVVVVMVAMR